MKYLIGLAALGLGALAQNPIHLPSHIEIDESIAPVRQSQMQKQIQYSDLPMDLATEFVPGHFQSTDPSNQHKVRQQGQEFEERSHKKHHKHDHDRARQFETNSIPGQHQKQRPEHMEQFEEKFRNEDDQRFENFNHENQEQFDRKHHKKFGKGKGLGHIIALVVIAVLSFFTIKACIKKRNRRNQGRLARVQNPSNPALVDEEIRKHYVEIQRLKQIKASLQMQFQEPQTIIYHQVYPQQIEMSNSHGRMINQNSNPKNPHFQNIPVGRPVTYNNPFNHPSIYRNQY